MKNNSYTCDVCKCQFNFNGTGRPNYGDGLDRCPNCKDNYIRHIQYSNRVASRHPSNCSCTTCFYDRMDKKYPGGHNY